MEYIREAKQRLFSWKSILFKITEKENIILGNFLRFSPWYLFKQIPIRYDISSNLTNNARYRYENERQAAGEEYVIYSRKS